MASLICYPFHRYPWLVYNEKYRNAKVGNTGFRIINKKFRDEPSTILYCSNEKIIIFTL